MKVVRRELVEYVSIYKKVMRVERPDITKPYRQDQQSPHLSGRHLVGFHEWIIRTLDQIHPVSAFSSVYSLSLVYGSMHLRRA